MNRVSNTDYLAYNIFDICTSSLKSVTITFHFLTQVLTYKDKWNKVIESAMQQ